MSSPPSHTMQKDSFFHLHHFPFQLLPSIMERTGEVPIWWSQLHPHQSQKQQRNVSANFCLGSWEYAGSGHACICLTAQWSLSIFSAVIQLLFTCFYWCQTLNGQAAPRAAFSGVAAPSGCCCSDAVLVKGVPFLMCTRLMRWAHCFGRDLGAEGTQVLLSFSAPVPLWEWWDVWKA